MMKNKRCSRILGFITVVLLTTISTLPAVAEDDPDDLSSLETFNINLGVFAVGRFNTTARFDSRTVPIGTVINLEDNFNLESSDTIGRIDGFYRINPRHRIDWTLYSSDREGSAVAQQEFIIGDPDDPDGQDIIPLGARVNTTWNLDILKIGYAWSFINTRDYEWFIGAGFNIHELEVDIAYKANVNNAVETDSFDARGDIPLPTATIGGRYQLSDKWRTNVRYELFFLKLGDYEGIRQDFMISLEHNTFSNVGFGVGLNIINLDVKATKEDFRGEFDSSMLGLLGYMKVYF